MAALFSRTAQTDVIAVLMLLGEATMWKAAWERVRARRWHWTQWVFAVSPGWAPLAATLFTLLSSAAAGAPNLVFDRPPEGTVDAGLVLTNLNSGASHGAGGAVLLQNVWSAWCRGPRRRPKGARRGDEVDGVTREVGVVDLDLDRFGLESGWPLWIQAACLAAQVVGSLVLALRGWGFETFVALCVALVGQTMILFAIIPSRRAWFLPVRRRKGCAVMLHRGLNSNEALIIRRTTLRGREISLEEFVWKNPPARGPMDTVKLCAAAAAFVILALGICLVNWMNEESRTLYLIFGSLGLCANALQTATPPNWNRAFYRAFTGTARCATPRSSLMGAVGILFAAGFPAAQSAAQELYPANERFESTATRLKKEFDDILCASCRHAVRTERPDHRCWACGRPMGSPCAHDCLRMLSKEARSLEEHRRWACDRLTGSPGASDCTRMLSERARRLVSTDGSPASKQQHDALASVAHFLRSLVLAGRILDAEVSQAYKDEYKWQPLV